VIRLAQLARLVGTDRYQGDCEIVGVRQDSRDIQPGDLFVAVRGARFDSHGMIGSARERGAVAVAVDAGREGEVPEGMPWVAVLSTRACIAAWSVLVYGDPTRGLHVTGVTGTNGKTSTVRLIDSIARATGEVTGTIGTLGAVVDGVELPHDRTTPEACDLQRLFAQMRRQGAASAAMEVASHALALGRVDGTLFDCMVFTNLTQDHLDFHGTMDAYREAKVKLFTDHADRAREAGKQTVVVTNIDDDTGRAIASRHRADRLIGYSPSGNADADVVADCVELRADRLTFRAKTPVGDIPVELRFGGTFQLSNALAAIGAAVGRGIDARVIAAGLAQCPPVPGRFEPVDAGQPFAALVDYAHTPDGLRNVLEAARPLAEGRLIVVFGCGGDRDRTKRPIMGRIATELADVVVVTSDNPRTEDPESIIREIEAGLETGRARVETVVDRRDAIRVALAQGRVGDVVVIAGKGHETYQEVGLERFPFDDRTVAREEWLRCVSR
jgi:UDP-N-acetylmuramoyl-L-alanyl-D-glutamate--2,6-diaminopimelate ligase